MTLRTCGWMRTSWNMHVGQYRILSQTCLGRQGPEGGVVLGLHINYDDSDLYFININIILL